MTDLPRCHLYHRRRVLPATPTYDRLLVHLKLTVVLPLMPRLLGLEISLRYHHALYRNTARLVREVSSMKPSPNKSKRRIGKETWDFGNAHFIGLPMTSRISAIRRSRLQKESPSLKPS